MSNLDNARSVAEDTINRTMNTEVGRKIITSKLIALTQENVRLKRKVADDRIAVFTLNALSRILVRKIENNHRLLNQHSVPMDDVSIRLSRELENFTRENYGNEMMDRVERILKDTEGDDILLRDLIGKEAEINNA
jgi:hypothetical protein